MDTKSVLLHSLLFKLFEYQTLVLLSTGHLGLMNGLCFPEKNDEFA